MTPLADRLLAVLRDEAGYPPLGAVKLAEVLRVTGYVGGPVSVGEVGTALVELVAADQVERVWRRGAAHYRAVAQPAAVAADGTDRPVPHPFTARRSRRLSDRGAPITDRRATCSGRGPRRFR